jgi:LemA protein
MDINLIITIVLALIVIFYLIKIFNNLILLRNRFKNSFSQIEVQLKRRHDLIPNLVKVAKGYLKHEEGTLTAVTSARNTAANALSQASLAPGDMGAMQNLSNAESALKNSVGKLNLVMEAYPDLKASQNMMQLSEELSSTENRISFARQSYNDQVMGYNTYKQSFPNNILAGLFGHAQDSSLLEFADSKEIQQVSEVSF